MEDKIIEWWVSLTAEKQAELYRKDTIWCSLSPPQRLYYNIKGGYFMRRKFISGLIALAVILIGVAAYFLQQSPLVAIGLVIIGIGLGVLFVWEVESK